jgi:hypothetical protein
MSSPFGAMPQPPPFLTPKRVLLVTYDLKTPSWDYNKFYETLKAQGMWWHYLSSSWLVATSSTPDQLYAALTPHLSQQDWILILPVKKPAFGWLPKEAWDWINVNLPSS